jgi:hypothetical protein
MKVLPVRRHYVKGMSLGNSESECIIEICKLIRCMLEGMISLQICNLIKILLQSALYS